MADVDYDALAAKLGGKDYTPPPIDYDVLAAKFGGRDATQSTMADIGKSAAYAIPKAFTSMAGLPADLRDLSALGRNKMLSWLPDSIGPAAGAVSNIADYMNPATAIAKLLPTSGRLRGAAEQVTGPWYDPQTRAGKVTDTALQTAALMGRNLLTMPFKTAGIVAGSTAGTETAGALSNDNPWLRFAGGLLGMSPVALASAYTNAPGKAVRQAIGDMTPAQITEAQAKQDAARAAGIPLMGPEALPDSGIQQLAADVAASRSGGAVMRPYLAQRPTQVRSAVQGGLLGPIGAADTPAANAARAQSAATQVIENAQAARTAATRPLYEQAATDVAPPASVQAVIDAALGRAKATDPEYAKALTKFASDLQTTRPGVPPGARLSLEQYRALGAGPQPRTEVGPLSDTYKRVREQLDIPTIGASQEDRIAQGILGPFNTQLGATLREASPTWARANQLYQGITRGTIEPLTAGPVGVVAGRTGFDAAAPSAVPRVTGVIANADVARPETIRSLYTNLNQVDRQAFPGVARTWLENAFNDATQRIQGGENRMMGANFAKSVFGTDQQRANFNEVLRGVAQAHGADPDQFVRGANTLMQTLEATGRIPGVGSPTAMRGALAEQLGKSPIADFTNLGGLVTGKTLAKRMNDALLAGRYGRLAEVFTAPDSVQQIARMAKLDPRGLTAQYVTAALLGLDRAAASE
jgi:hypothetical protein